MKNRSYSTLFLIFISIATSVFGQMAGNPAGVKGGGEFSLSVSGTYLNQGLANETAISKRILGKAIWGATSKIDLFLTLGSVGLKMQSKESGVSDYEDKKRFAFGLGLNAELVSQTEISPYSIWINAKALRFKSSGTYYISEQSGITTWQSDLIYDWREVQVSLCAKYNLSTFRLYGGILGWMLQRHDEKSEYWSGKWWGPDRQTYQTGMWTGGLVGVEFLLPNQYSFSIEGILFNTENYQIMIGISQTGLQ